MPRELMKSEKMLLTGFEVYHRPEVLCGLVCMAVRTTSTQVWWVLLHACTLRINTTRRASPSGDIASSQHICRCWWQKQPRPEEQSAVNMAASRCQLSKCSVQLGIGACASHRPSLELASLLTAGNADTPSAPQEPAGHHEARHADVRLCHCSRGHRHIAGLHGRHKRSQCSGVPHAQPNHRLLSHGLPRPSIGSSSGLISIIP